VNQFFNFKLKFKTSGSEPIFLNLIEYFLNSKITKFHINQKACLLATILDLAILIRPFGFIASKTLNYLAFQSLDLSVPDEVYSRNGSRALNFMSTFLLENMH
jgi:hypothetical protein